MRLVPQVLKVLVKLYTVSGTVSDYVSVCTCLMFLEDHSAVAKILDQLLMGSDDDCLLAYQIGFDLFENEIQQFLLKVRDELSTNATPPPPPSPAVLPTPAADPEVRNSILSSLPPIHCLPLIPPPSSAAEARWGLKYNHPKTSLVIMRRCR
jgi:26S proteasome regulatory subunit N2